MTLYSEPTQPQGDTNETQDHDDDEPFKGQLSRLKAISK